MKNFVLVAGYDYERHGLPFREHCDNRVKRLVAADRSHDDMTFQIFDVGSGEVVTREFTFPAGTRTEKTTVTRPFTRLTTANYNQVVSGGERHYSFKNGQSGMMSVTDVYAAVRAVGAAAPGTLMELSFFSHAWHGGPILVNSFDDGVMEVPSAVPGVPPTIVAVGAARDPDDKDPRVGKDFAPANMSAAELAEFRAAYHVDGFNWSWGCAFPRLVHEILHKLEYHRDYRSTGLPDAQLFVFTNLRTDHVDLLNAHLGITLPNPRRVELTFGSLKTFFCRMIVASYNHELAVRSQRKTFGGMIGTYSEPDTGRLPLMHINKGFGRHFAFYKNYFAFAFDPEDRKYGLYDPAFTC